MRQVRSKILYGWLQSSIRQSSLYFNFDMLLSNLHNDLLPRYGSVYCDEEPEQEWPGQPKMYDTTFSNSFTELEGRYDECAEWGI